MNEYLEVVMESHRIQLTSLKNEDHEKEEGDPYYVMDNSKKEGEHYSFFYCMKERGGLLL
ncbi:hypothetical protein KXD40_005487 [Peronospora effusa]|nr:hypothetical protein KXD40_005487 [Peronospora effusa]